MIDGHKVAAYTALHYGREFLSWAIHSIIDDVDEYHVLYAPQGSHLTRTAEPCPESRDELYILAQRAAGNKLRWTDGNWTQEHQQRDTIYQLTDAPIIVALDADEVWYPGLLPAVMQFGLAANVSDVRVPFWHYFRSLKKVIKHDPAYPVRVRLRHQPSGVTTFSIPSDCGEDFRIHHYGYAQSSNIVRYKLSIHYHQNEFVPGYFENIFMKNVQNGCHPCGQVEWITEDCGVMPFLAGHPYAGLEIIE
jgi:hypothetical protein